MPIRDTRTLKELIELQARQQAQGQTQPGTMNDPERYDKGGYLKSHRYGEASPQESAEYNLRRLLGEKPERIYSPASTEIRRFNRVREDLPKQRKKRNAPNIMNGQEFDKAYPDAPYPKVEDTSTGDTTTEDEMDIVQQGIDGAPSTESDPINIVRSMFVKAAKFHEWTPDPGADYGYENHPDFEEIKAEVEQQATEMGITHPGAIDTGIAQALDEMGWNK